MKPMVRFALFCNVVLACVACSPSPQADTATRPAPAPAQAAGPTAMDSSATAPDALMARAKISREAATQTALAQVPDGTIQDAELEEEHQELVWSFDIAMPGSRDITEIQVDAVTGGIVSRQIETPTDQAQENAADKVGQ